MKKTFFIPLVVLGIVITSGFAFTNHVAHAQGASMYAPGHLYNLNFKFKERNRHITTNEELRAFIQELIAYLQQLQGLPIPGNVGDVEVATQSATQVDNNSAVLNGEVTDFDDSDYAMVRFAYGRSSTALTSRTPSEKIDDSGDGQFDYDVTNLREDTQYYFRAIARDDQGGVDYGSILHFRTDGEVLGGDDPEVSTLTATGIQDDSAMLRGEVDMNDFENGEVFFVYGEDEDQIDDVADDFETYNDVDEDGANLQKVLVDTDLDFDDSYEEEVQDLDNDTSHYFSICVGYEDEDSDDVLLCGGTRSFTTDI